MSLLLPARRHLPVFAAVLGLLAVHVALALTAVRGKSVTGDEIFHITGGYLYDRFGDYRIHPDNGVMPQRLEALPAVLAGARAPALAGNDAWLEADVPRISYQFFYGSGNDHWPLLMGARTVALGFSLGLLILVFAWTWHAAGLTAAFTALSLAALSPTLLAHGPLATTDTVAACLLTASACAFWWQLRTAGRWPLLASAAVFGLACTAKYSAVLLLPVFALLVVLHSAGPAGGRGPGKTGTSLAVHAAAAWALIWATFGFRYAAFAPGLPPAEHFALRWDWMLDHAGWQGGPIRWARDHRLLPEGFLFGYTHTYLGSLARSAYLAGEYSVTGWRSFFPLAFLWKSTPVELGGLTLGLVGAGLSWRRLGRAVFALAPLLALAAVYGLAAVFSNLNIGHRHLLPLYPPLFMAVGIAASRLAANRKIALVLVALLCAGQAASAISIHPDYLAYFNRLAGGPDNGWRLLVDSSLDWGQDLPGLKAWLDRHNAGPAAAPVYLSYFGSGEPRYYGIKADRLLFVNGFRLPSAWCRPGAGLYCISATMLAEVYSPLRGDWTVDNEREYQELRRVEEQFREWFQEPDARPRLLAYAPASQWEKAWSRFEVLRHARLCACLRGRRPEAVIGHTIMIYRLSAEDVARMLERPYSDWLRAAHPAAE